MVFITNSKIYENDEVKENVYYLKGLEIRDFVFEDEFGVYEKVLEKYENPVTYGNFYEKFKVFGNVVFYDEDVLIVNGKIIRHNFLPLKRRKELFNDIDPVEEFIKKHVKFKDYLFISDEFEEAVSVKEAFKRLKNFLFKEIEIKVNGNYVKKTLPFEEVFHHIDRVFFRVKKEYLLNTSLNGAGVVKFYKNDNGVVMSVGKKVFEIKYEELI